MLLFSFSLETVPFCFGGNISNTGGTCLFRNLLMLSIEQFGHQSHYLKAKEHSQQPTAAFYTLASRIKMHCPLPCSVNEESSNLLSNHRQSNEQSSIPLMQPNTGQRHACLLVLSIIPHAVSKKRALDNF